MLGLESLTITHVENYLSCSKPFPSYSSQPDLEKKPHVPESERELETEGCLPVSRALLDCFY